MAAVLVGKTFSSVALLLNPHTIINPDAIGTHLLHPTMFWFVETPKMFCSTIQSILWPNTTSTTTSCQLQSTFSSTCNSSSLSAAAANQDLRLSVEEVETVMKRMIGSNTDHQIGNGNGNGNGTELSAEEMQSMFDEVEPSVEELGQAFSVFDENKDGFIDAKELQSVLCRIGFAKTLRLEECEGMIEAHDQDGDGKINFNEFGNLILDGFTH